MSEKIAILVPSNLWFCPFVNIYTSLLRLWDISYDIIYWDRYNNTNNEGIAYHGKIGNSAISKFIGYFNYATYLKSHLVNGHYSKVIVFSSQIGIFLAKFLKKNFRGRYIFDFRDLSIEQSKLFSKRFNMLLMNSFANVISSPGFLRCLPSSYKYVLSHNFSEVDVRKALQKNCFPPSNSLIDILTIGGIRDYESNAELMDVIGNNTLFNLRFVGKGPSAKDLENYAKSKGYKNVIFEGYYEKDKEADYIKDATLLNIYYPKKISHETALSNRFYNSLIYRRPMIVTKGQIQGDYCEKYNVGIAISDIQMAPRQIKEWLENLDYQQYESNCIELLNQFIEDHNRFKDLLKSFCTN